MITSKLLLKIVKATTPKSIGVIAMNEDQRDLIEDYLQESIREYGDCLPKPLFIRTIDTVQGEERDFILISLTYGPGCRKAIRVRNFGADFPDPWRQAGQCDGNSLSPPNRDIQFV